MSNQGGRLDIGRTHQHFHSSRQRSRDTALQARPNQIEHRLPVLHRGVHRGHLRQSTQQVRVEEVLDVIPRQIRRPAVLPVHASRTEPDFPAGFGIEASAMRVLGRGVGRPCGLSSGSSHAARRLPGAGIARVPPRDARRSLTCASTRALPRTPTWSQSSHSGTRGLKVGELPVRDGCRRGAGLRGEGHVDDGCRTAIHRLNEVRGSRSGPSWL